MRGAMMFGPIVGSVVGSGAPVVPELALGVVTMKPMESYIHCFGGTWLYVVGDHAESSAVISLDRCGGLLVSHLSNVISLSLMQMALSFGRAYSTAAINKNTFSVPTLE